MWSKDQIVLAAWAARSSNLADWQRSAILSGVPDHRAVHKGRVTSTSPRLNQGDFEQYMATVERHSPGGCLVLRTKGKDVRDYGHGHWQRKCDGGELVRLRHVICFRVVPILADNLPQWSLAQASLSSWIHSQITSEANGEISRLDISQLRQLLNGLTGLAKRHGLDTSRPSRKDSRPCTKNHLPI